MRAASAYTISSWIFLRLLGVVYGVAFWSLDAQLLGLVGSGGILPAAETMAEAERWSRELGAIDRFIQWPTVFWLGTGDAWLTGACRAGILLSIPLIAGVGTVFVLPLLWILYLSLATVTGDFLAFQWDSLLLESGLLAIAFVPWRTIERPGQDAPVPLARALLWWLLFRLMFASGVVKLTSGDPMWRALTAMSVHYETQPLPTPVGWFAHHLPAWFNEASTLGVFAVELLLPWCMLWRGTPRRMAAVGFVALQAGIAITGNYAFFNLLSAALALTLLDDETWRRVVPEQWLHRADARDVPPTRLQQDGPRVAAVILALVVVPVSADIVASQLRITLPGAHWARALRGELLPFRSINAYGLFAVITPTRPEIALEVAGRGHMATVPLQVQARRAHGPTAVGGTVPAQTRLADVVRRTRRTGRVTLVRPLLPAPARGVNARPRPAGGQSLSRRATDANPGDAGSLSDRIAARVANDGRVVDERPGDGVRLGLRPS